MVKKNKQDEKTKNKENASSQMSQEDKIKSLLAGSKLSSKEVQALPKARVTHPQYKKELNQARENTLVQPFQKQTGQKRPFGMMNEGSAKSEKQGPAKKAKIEGKENAGKPKRSLLDVLRGNKSSKPQEKPSKEEKRGAKAAKKNEKNFKKESSIAITGKKPKGKFKKKLDNIKENLKSALHSNKSPKSRVVEERGVSPSQARKKLEKSGFAAKYSKSQGKSSARGR